MRRPGTASPSQGGDGVAGYQTGRLPSAAERRPQGYILGIDGYIYRVYSGYISRYRP